MKKLKLMIEYLNIYTQNINRISKKNIDIINDSISDIRYILNK